MLIVCGTKHFSPTRVAFRNDYCLSCDGMTLACHIRTFVMFHLFWIPLVPLGFRRTWICSNCGERPECSPGTRNSYKLVGAIFIIPFGLLLTAMSLSKNDTGILAVGAVITVLGIGLLLWWISSRSTPRYREQFAQVRPYDSPDCPFCDLPLTPSQPPRCANCQVEQN